MVDNRPLSNMDEDRDDMGELLDLTPSSSESSYSTDESEFYPPQVPIVLELHDIKKDDQSPGPEENPVVTGSKLKKHKKKKKGNSAKDKRHSTESTDTVSDSGSIPPTAAEAKEEFYDAHESYHAIPENQGPLATAPTVAAVAVPRLQDISESSDISKAPPVVAAPSADEQTTPPATKKDSAITTSMSDTLESFGVPSRTATMPSPVGNCSKLQCDTNTPDLRPMPEQAPKPTSTQE